MSIIEAINASNQIINAAYAQSSTVDSSSLKAAMAIARTVSAMILEAVRNNAEVPDVSGLTSVASITSLAEKIAASEASGGSSPLDQLTQTIVGKVEDGTIDTAEDFDASNLEIPIVVPTPTLTTYSWSTGAWSACSGACGTNNATQTRAVTCTASTGGSVADGMCSTAKPAVSQACTASVCTYTIGGSVSGLLGGGNVILSLNNGEELNITQNGGFAFSGSLPDASNYAVTVQAVDLISNIPAIQHCEVKENNGYINDANVTNIAVNCSHELFFAAYDGINGLRLWKTNNTQTDAQMVKDIDSNYVGIANNNRPDLAMATLHNTVYFVAVGSQQAPSNLWKSDGTETGTEPVLYGGDKLIFTSDLTIAGESLYFIAIENNIFSLYRLTREGEPEVVQMPVAIEPFNHIVIGQTLYMNFGNRHLVKVDGTTATQIAVTEENFVAGLGSLNDMLYFVECIGEGSACTFKKVDADSTVSTMDMSFNIESIPEMVSVAGDAIYLVDLEVGKVFRNDGTKTELLGENLGYIYEVAAAGDGVYLASDDTGELLRADVSGVHAVPNPNQWPWSMAAVGDMLYFAAWNNDLDVDELLVYNPETNTTVSVPGVANPEHLFTVGDTLYFQGWSSDHGEELYALNSVAEGARLVCDINQNSGGSFPASFVQVGDSFYFAANDDDHGRELWVSDGTEAGTRMLQDIRTGDSSNPNYLMAAGDKLFFTAFNNPDSFALWGGDAQGVAEVGIFDSLWARIFYSYAAVGNKVYFTNDTGNLWVSDGTSAPTTILGGAQRNSLTAMGDTLYYQKSSRLYAHTSGQTTEREVSSTNLTSNVKMVVAGDTLFILETTYGQAHIYKSNGNTTLEKLKSFNSNIYNSWTFPKLASIGDIVYFTAADGDSGMELWRSDGTDTEMVKDITLDGHTSFTSLAAVGDVLYFGANGSLWKTNGTAEGTQQVVADVNPTNLFGFNGKLYFSAYDGKNGEELWCFDPTTGEAKLFKDIQTPTYDGITWGQNALP